MSDIDTTTKSTRTTSEAQIKANRENAKRSTGPRTEQGKARSRLNALRFGLTADTIVLPGEDPEELEMLYARIFDDLEPEGDFEEQLVQRIFCCLWRLRRCERVEEELYAYRLLQDIEEDALAETKPLPSLTRMENTRYYSEDVRRQGVVTAVVAGDEIQEVSVSMGRAFIRDLLNGNGLAHLSRYETTHLRNLQRYCTDLERRQAQRLAGRCHRGNSVSS